MLQNFFKTTLRNILAHKGFSLINILGLTLGLTACLLIGLFVRDEKHYDRFVPGAESIFRVYQQAETDADEIIATVPPAFATALQQNFPGVEQALRVLPVNSKELFEVDQRKFYETGGFVTDSNFFELFPLPLQYGSYHGALKEKVQKSWSR